MTNSVKTKRGLQLQKPNTQMQAGNTSRQAIAQRRLQNLKQKALKRGGKNANASQQQMGGGQQPNKVSDDHEKYKLPATYHIYA